MKAFYYEEDDIQAPEFEFNPEFDLEEETLGSELESYSKKQAFCALLTPIADDKESMEGILTFMLECQSHKLVGEVPKALTNLDSYYDEVVELKEKSREELARIGQYYLDSKTQNNHAAAGIALHDHGDSSLAFGCDPKSVQVPEEIPNLESALGDISSAVKYACHEKESKMINVKKSIVKSLPVTVKSKLKSESSINQMVDKLLDDFEEGKSRVKFNKEKFSFSKEPGVALPHTLDPKSWLATISVAAIQKLFGPSFVLAFREHSDDHISRYQDVNDYILIDDDEDSHMHIYTNPSLYCQDYSDNGKWMWRDLQRIIKAEVNAYLENAGEVTGSQSLRLEYLKKIKLSHARRYAPDDGGKWNTYEQHPYLLGVPEQVTSLKGNGKKFLLKFAKRGLSTAQEVMEDPSVIHFVSNNVADSISSNSHFPLLLPDLTTVMMIPILFWSMSNYVKNNGKSSSFSSSFGLHRPKQALSSVAIYMTFYHLSHVREMFRKWVKGESYDYDSHKAFLLENLSSRDSNFLSMFGSDRSNHEILHRMVAPFIRMAGSLRGYFVTSVVSKEGRSTMREVMQHEGFAKEMDGFDFYDGGDTTSLIFDLVSDDVHQQRIEAYDYDYSFDDEGDGQHFQQDLDEEGVLESYNEILAHGEVSDNLI
jgi:hypothetical protein